MPPKGDKTRNLILEKATELFIQRGYSAVTMKDICDATGLSRGGLYRHFNSIGEMMGCLLSDEQHVVEEKFRKDIAEGKTALDILDAYIQAHSRFLLSSNSCLEVAANQYSLLDEGGKKINTSRVRATVKRLTYIIRQGQREGVFIDGDSESMAWHIAFFICGFRSQTVLDETGDDFIHIQMDCIRRFLLNE